MNTVCAKINTFYVYYTGPYIHLADTVLDLDTSTTQGMFTKIIKGTDYVVFVFI